MGLLDNITRVSEDVKEGVKAAEPTVQAVDSALKTLPDGGLKEWLRKDPKAFWSSIINLIKGKRFQTGQYILGERFMDQMLGMNVGRQQVPDDAVKQAQYFFTLVFGVRINNSEDLDALDYGVEAYFKRPNKQDIPRAAVERAVRLKQQYYPISTYNKGTWDPIHWEKDPLIAPIPAVGVHDTLEEESVNKLFNGPLPGGATAVNGIIEGDDPLKKMLEGMGWRFINGQWYAPGPDGTPGGGGPISNGGTPGKENPKDAGLSTEMMVVAGLVIIGTLAFSKPQKRRRG